VPSKLADRKVDARGNESFGMTEAGDLAEHRLRDGDGFVWLSSAFVEVARFGRACNLIVVGLNLGRCNLHRLRNSVVGEFLQFKRSMDNPILIRKFGYVIEFANQSTSAFSAPVGHRQICYNYVIFNSSLLQNCKRLIFPLPLFIFNI